MADSHDHSDHAPPTLQYASKDTPRPQFAGLITGVFCGLLIIVFAGTCALLAVEILRHGISDGRGYTTLLGATGAILSLALLFTGIVQLLASFVAMWNPTRKFWWDDWFVTIGRHSEKLDD